jgi:D-3-phosphoglycerate dehydrogenase
LKKIILAGQAVQNKSIKLALTKYFQIIEVNPRHLFETLKTIEDCEAVWIHVDTFIPEDEIKSFEKVTFLISTTTGLSHISKRIRDKFDSNLITLNGQREFLQDVSSTAEHAWALIMYGTNNLNLSIDSVEAGGWNRLIDVRENQLRSLVLGIIGYGRLGKIVAQYGKSFNMKVIVNDVDKTAKDDARIDGFEIVSEIKEMLRICDIVSIHADLNDNSEMIIDKSNLSVITKPLLLINTARAGLVDEKAIIDEIIKRDLLRYFTDVLAVEECGESVDKSELWKASIGTDRIVITPHVGGANREAMDKCEKFLFDQLINKISYF